MGRNLHSPAPAVVHQFAVIFQAESCPKAVTSPRGRYPDADNNFPRRS
jgi:hypothetical protein